MENRHLFALLTVITFVFTPEGKRISKRSFHPNLSKCEEQVSSFAKKVNEELRKSEFDIEEQLTDHSSDASFKYSDKESSFNKKKEDELKDAAKKCEEKNDKIGEKLEECVNQEQNRYYSDFGEGLKRCVLCFADHTHIANCEIHWHKRYATEKLNENNDKAKELDKICKDTNSDSKGNCSEDCKKLLEESEKIASTSIEKAKKAVKKHEKEMLTCLRELDDSWEVADKLHEENLNKCTA